jgi:hypothetical protein
MCLCARRLNRDLPTKKIRFYPATLYFSNRRSRASAMAVIEGARVAAAHEGHAELVVNIRYSNGGSSEVALGAAAADLLMQSCNATTLEQLKGQSWQKVQTALVESHNHYNDQDL